MKLDYAWSDERLAVEQRLVRFLQVCGDWFPGDNHTERQWTYRTEGLLFHLITDIGRQMVWVQTEPLSASAVYYSSSMPDEKVEWRMMKELVMPIVDRHMLLDDLAAIIR